jgi:hypothetical protein
MSHHPDFVSPIKMHIMQTSLVFRGAPLSTIINTLEKILSETECLKFVYERKQVPSESQDSEKKETVRFVLEYCTIPKLRTLGAKERQYYHEFEMVMMDAFDKALEWFPHNAPEKEQHPEDYLPPPPQMRRQWFAAEINILFNQPDAPDGIILEFFRIVGDHWTHHWFYGYVGERLQQEFLWSSRSEYLSLMDGCPDSRIDGCPVANGHIARFLFDDFVARDICTYMSGNK